MEQVDRTPAAARLKVCLYGGSARDGTPLDFVSNVAEEILRRLPAVIVTGGYVGSDGLTSERAALTGAVRFAAASGCPLSALYEAWLPDSGLKPDSSRMSTELGITVRDLSGRTALARRLRMVSGTDVLVTFTGRTHTELVLELALELGVPALPVAPTGGKSERIYAIYPTRVEAGFGPGTVARAFATYRQYGWRDPRSVNALVAAIATARVGRCLVLQPYGSADDRLYESLLRPAIETEMVPLRLKDAAHSQSIYSSFFEAADLCTAAVADVSRLNENVMYEVGYLHSRGVQPLLFTMDPLRVDALPVYFRTLNVHTVTEATLPELVRAHLRQVKGTRPSIATGADT